MLIDLETAARLGASAGLLAEGEPKDIASWPAAAQTVFNEQYARGRKVRLIAEGKATFSREPPDLSRYEGLTRAHLMTEFNSRADLQNEFGEVESFVAFALAAQAGRARILGGRVVS